MLYRVREAGYWLAENLRAVGVYLECASVGDLAGVGDEEKRHAVASGHIERRRDFLGN